MNDNIYLDDLENDQIIWFSSDRGFSINTRSQCLRIFEKNINGRWSHQLMQIADIRSIEQITLSPVELMKSGRGGLDGVGESIGLAMRDSMEKAKAEKGTGVKLYLKSVDTPSLFISVPDEKQREALFEGLNQIVDTGSMTGSLKLITPEIRQVFHRPTPEEIAHFQRSKEREKRRAKAFVPRLKHIPFLLVFSAIMTWPTYLLWGDNQYSQYSSARLSKDLTIIFIGWLCVSNLGVSIWRFIKA